MAQIYYISHPKVKIDSKTLPKEWEISPKGLKQLEKLFKKPWISKINAIYSSNEKKTIGSAKLTARKLNITHDVFENLGSTNRTKTSFLTDAEFKTAAENFYKHPNKSSFGWEKATDVQKRNIKALEKIIKENTDNSNIAIWGHGNAGTLLLCHLLSVPISKKYDQSQLGSYFIYNAKTKKVIQTWKPID